MSSALHPAELTSMFSRCLAFDVVGATGPELDAHAAVLVRVASWIDAQRALVGAARRRMEDAASEAVGHQGAGNPRPRRRAGPVPGPGSGSRSQAVREADVAEGARRCPAFAHALAAGELSTDHLAALGRVRNAAEATADEAALLAAALARGADEFAVWLRAWDDGRDVAHGIDLAERRRSKRKVQFGIDDDGMQVTRAVLGPVEHAKVSQALHEAADARWRDGDRTSSLPQRLADALVALITGASTAPLDAAAPHAPRRPGAPVVLAILHDAWMRAEADRIGIATTLDGVALTATELRLALCEANVLPVVLGGDGQILDVGRARRVATHAQWRALLGRNGGCVVLGCAAPASWTVVHHCRPWEDGGPTDLSNLCLLCPTHHRELHHRRWRACVDGGVVRITTIAGHDVPTRNRNGPVAPRGAGAPRVPDAAPRAA